MNMNEFYASIGAHIEYPLHRLGSPQLLEKYLHKLLTDCTFSQLSTAIACGQCQDAFRAAHTLKGIALNLELTPMVEPCIQLTELLRNTQEMPASAAAQFDALASIYRAIIAKLKHVCA